VEIRMTREVAAATKKIHLAIGEYLHVANAHQIPWLDSGDGAPRPEIFLSGVPETLAALRTGLESDLRRAKAFDEAHHEG
jgi:hypothetical protein